MDIDNTASIGSRLWAGLDSNSGRNYFPQHLDCLCLTSAFYPMNTKDSFQGREEEQKKAWS
jgi:hypothetical protein